MSQPGIEPSNLKNYSTISSVLSPSLRGAFPKSPSSKKYQAKASLIALTQRLYACFIDITSLEENHVTNYSGLDILNNNDALNFQYRRFLSFIYRDVNITTRTKYKYAKCIECFYLNMIKNTALTFLPVKVSIASITNDILQCIQDAGHIKVNTSKLRFYQGWKVTTKEGKDIDILLSDVCLQYGGDFTDKLHQAAKKYLSTTKTNTCHQCLNRLHSLLVSFLKLYPTQADFLFAMSFDRITDSMMLVYNLQLIQARQRQLDMKYFHSGWRNKVALFYHVFINQGLVDEPLIDIIVPEFRSSNFNSSSKTSRDTRPNVFNKKLITPVPLSYTDTQAKEAIFDAIIKDIQHVQYRSEIVVEQIMMHYSRYESLSRQGDIKDSKQTKVLVKKGVRSGLLGGYNPVAVGKNNPANVVATFDYYGFNDPTKNGYASFLGFQGNAGALRKLLSLPSRTLLYPFLALLVIEHPSITQSWLENWQLYDKNNRPHGFKKVGNQWVAVSVKNRRGAKLAQQLVILNKRSRYLVECIIKLTTRCRNYLKDKEHDDYRFMLLIAPGLTSVKRVSAIDNPSNSYSSNIKSIYQEPSFTNGVINRSRHEAIDITNDLTLKRLRASMGVRVYLETKSVHAMSEALGHDHYDPRLLGHYLPKVLWDYFTNRWVRIFQNAIVYEAMKGSSLLFDAVDFTEEELDEFINNHGLGKLPDHLIAGKERAKDLTNDDICADESVVTVSVALLQLFIALVHIVENIGEHEQLKTVAQKWFETAQFVLSSFELAIDKQKSQRSKFNLESDVLEMYDIAKRTPLDVDMIKGVLLS